MNLQFISWDDLNAIKENLDQYVSKFALPSNAWIEEELGHSPFLNTKYPMPDIHLDMSQPMDKAYLTDAANVQEFYGKLRFISDSQASDERLWAGLCLGPFYEYTQYRWKIAQKCTKPAKKSSPNLKKLSAEKEYSKAEAAKRNTWPPQIKHWRSQLILLPASCGRAL